MGVKLSRAQVVSGLEPTSAFTVETIRAIFQKFEDCCPSPALWERAFYELLGCFSSPEAARKAFTVLDTDVNGLIDAREIIGALAILSKGHLKERMALLFDIFDLNKERAIAFDECFLLLRRTMGGLRKTIAISIPPEKVIYNMTKQVWKIAKKHKDTRVSLEEWYTWWGTDASIRIALKMVTWKPEDQRGLPTPDHFVNVDYTSGMEEFDTELDAKRASKRPGGSKTPYRASLDLPPDDKRESPSLLQVPGSRRGTA
uniref:EF-hand domain-containing protein n=1 Tax=Alexandrium catenella TaxID=2925 RepID=A0A7S1WWT8_ALECA